MVGTRFVEESTIWPRFCVPCSTVAGPCPRCRICVLLILIKKIINACATDHVRGLLDGFIAGDTVPQNDAVNAEGYSAMDASSKDPVGNLKPVSCVYVHIGSVWEHCEL